MEEKNMANTIRDQFERDMQVGGLAGGTRKRYLSAVDGFFKTTWLSAESVTEADVQSHLIALRERKVARETFRGSRFALQYLFETSLGRDWPLFKKN